MLAENDAIEIEGGDWILDSGASRNLVNDESLLIDSTTCVHEISMTDGESGRLTRVVMCALRSSHAVGRRM